MTEGKGSRGAFELLLLLRIRMYVFEHSYRGKGMLVELVLSFHFNVVSRNEAQVVGFSWCYALSHFTTHGRPSGGERAC